MNDLNFSSGDKIAQAIDKRIISVAKQVYNSSPMNKSKYGRVTDISNGLYSVVIEGSVYKKVPALSSVGFISKGSVVLCLIPNNQFSNIVIIGSLGDGGSTHSSLPLGMIVPVSVISDDPNLHLADGSSLLQNGIYSQFCTWLKARAVEKSTNVPICSIEEYATEMATYGQCAKYVINNTSSTLTSGNYSVEANAIKLPTITEFVASSNGGDVIGLAELDMFKSHTHTQMRDAHTRMQLGYGVSTHTGVLAETASTVYINSVETQATGGSETRPKNVRYPYYIVVATGIKTPVEINLDNIINEINFINKGLSKTEEIEVIYYYDDEHFNKNYPSGIPSEEEVAFDLSQYKSIDAIFGDGGRAQVFVHLDLTIPTSGGTYAGGATYAQTDSAFNNQMLSKFYYMTVNAAKTQIHFSSGFTYNGNSNVTTTYKCYKIIGRK